MSGGNISPKGILGRRRRRAGSFSAPASAVALSSESAIDAAPPGAVSPTGHGRHCGVELGPIPPELERLASAASVGGTGYHGDGDDSGDGGGGTESEIGSPIVAAGRVRWSACSPLPPLSSAATATFTAAVVATALPPAAPAAPDEVSPAAGCGEE